MVSRLLRSLSARDHDSGHELELIVVDNNSGDDSVETVRRDFPDVKVVAQSKNRGFAGGVNPGVRVATQPLVLLLNSDAETSRPSIETMAEYMAEFPEVGVLGPRMLNVDGTHQPSCWRQPALGWLALSALGFSKLRAFDFENYGRKEFTEAAEVEGVCGSAMMIRRDLWSDMEGLDEDYFMYFEETDFCVRARRAGWKVHYAPIGEFVHEAGGTSKSLRLRTFLEFRRSEILFHLKHGGLAAAVGARGLLAIASAVRVPPLALLSVLGTSERARTQLNLHWKGLRWLLNPSDGLVPDVDRSQ